MAQIAVGRSSLRHGRIGSLSLERSHNAVSTTGLRPTRSATRGSPNRRLLPLENFVDCGLAAFVDANDSVDRLETGHRDIHDVVPRSEHDVDWRDLIKDPLVDCNLRAFRQGANGDGTHASRALSAAS